VIRERACNRCHVTHVTGCQSSCHVPILLHAVTVVVTAARAAHECLADTRVHSLVVSVGLKGDSVTVSSLFHTRFNNFHIWYLTFALMRPSPTSSTAPLQQTVVRAMMIA